MSDHRVPPGDASAGQLLSQVTEDISTLIRDELQLAKQDLAESGKRVGVGVGMFGLAGTLALYGLGALIATIILAVAEGLEPWIAAGIVTLVLFIAAAVAAVVGKGSVSKAGDAPHERTESLKADVAAVRPNHEGGTS